MAFELTSEWDPALGGTVPQGERRSQSPEVGMSLACLRKGGTGAARAKGRVQGDWQV